MCYEDIKLGLRRQARITVLPIGTKNIAADSRRVLIRIAIVASAALDNHCSLSTPGAGDAPIAIVNAGNPNAELMLERHGSLVMSSFDLVNNGAAVLTEIFDTTLYSAPD